MRIIVWMSLLLACDGYEARPYGRYPASSAGATEPAHVARVFDPPTPEVDVPKIFESVVHVRGLQPKAAVPVEKLSDADFDRAFLSVTHGDGPATGSPKSATKDPKFFDGFYAFKTKSILVREHPKLKGDPRIVIAHELVHALQHQHFGIDKIATDGPDADMALLALVEGDAQMTAYGAIAAMDGVPPSRVMIMSSAHRASDDAAIALGIDIATLPYDERQRLVFPYADGEHFVGSMYRAGHFDLINRLYAAPPKSTSFVLHPDAYLAGLPIHPVAPIVFPKEAKVTAASGHRLGEAGFRSLLVSLGMPPKRAESIGASWRGDWVSVAKRADAASVASGVVIFSNENDAEDARLRMAQTMTAIRHGETVSFASGLPADLAVTITESGFSKVGPAPIARAPFGPLVIPPAPVLLEHQVRFGGRFTGSAFVDPGLGLTVPVPGAYRVTINGDLLLVLADGHTSMGVWLMGVGQTPWARAQIREEVLDSARTMGTIQGYEDDVIDSRFGPVPERKVLLTDGRYLRVAMISICRHHATLLIGRLFSKADYMSARSSQILEDWFSSIDGDHVTDSDFCKGITEEWSTDLP